jgi:hypothetical protein
MSISINEIEIEIDIEIDTDFQTLFQAGYFLFHAPSNRVGLRMKTGLLVMLSISISISISVIQIGIVEKTVHSSNHFGFSIVVRTHRKFK